MDKCCVENVGESRRVSTGKKWAPDFNRRCGKEKANFVENFGDNVES